jgi:hypothetical protein
VCFSLLFLLLLAKLWPLVRLQIAHAVQQGSFNIF